MLRSAARAELRIGVYRVNVSFQNLATATFGPTITVHYAARADCDTFSSYNTSSSYNIYILDDSRLLCRRRGNGGKALRDLQAALDEYMDRFTESEEEAMRAAKGLGIIAERLGIEIGDG